jgi:hypothetical protein
MKMENVVAVGAVIVGLFASGCTSVPKYPNTLDSKTVKTIRLQENIYTPSSLYVPSPDIGQSDMLTVSHGPVVGGTAGGIGGAVQNAKINEFTAAVRQDIDFQKFAADTLRNAFLRAVKKHTEWTVTSSPDQPADAILSLGILRMGTRGPIGLFPPKYAPTVSIAATMTDPAAPSLHSADSNAVHKESIIYQRIASNDSIKPNKDAYALAPASGFSGLPKYSGDVELFKRAFTEAIEQAVNQLAESWQ